MGAREPSEPTGSVFKLKACFGSVEEGWRDIKSNQERGDKQGG
jgi:hypothetical protein